MRTARAKREREREREEKRRRRVNGERVERGSENRRINNLL